MENYYELLEIIPTASVEMVKAAYKVACKKYHPDVYGGQNAEIAMKTINQAYEILSDEMKRKEYDLKISALNRQAAKKTPPPKQEPPPENAPENENRRRDYTPPPRPEPPQVPEILTKEEARKFKGEDIIVPYGYKTIGYEAFGNRHDIKSVTIRNSMNVIGKKAFSGCINLQSVIIPTGVTSIGDRAFSGCISLTSVKIPDSVTYIGGTAFGFCINLENITIPNSVTTIAEDAFFNCKKLTIKCSASSYAYSRYSRRKEVRVEIV